MIPNVHAREAILQQGPPPAEADAVLVLLHGRGATAEDILGLGSALGGNRVACVAPQAGGHTWYPQSFLAPRQDNEPYLGYALDRVAAVVQDLGVATDKVVICGFSQGACLACEFVARHPARYGGLVAFTGGLIGPPGTPLHYPGDLRRTPVFLSGGDPDGHVPFERLRDSADAFRQMGGQVRLERYPGKPHSISSAEVEAARQTLAAAQRVNSPSL